MNIHREKDFPLYQDIAVRVFKKTPVNGIALAQRKLVKGVGINDADYNVTFKNEGKRLMCPVYRKWVQMLARVYCPKYQAKQPTYKKVTVCTEWLTFSNFAKWYEEYYVEGYHLDKDIKVKGNTVYSPDTCLFVPHAINNLILDNSSFRGEFPLGVSFHKPTSKYRADVTVDGKQKYLGGYVTPELAHTAYKKGKNEELYRKMQQFPYLAIYLKQYLFRE
jgi:hypothetical protein